MTWLCSHMELSREYMFVVESGQWVRTCGSKLGWSAVIIGFFKDCKFNFKEIVSIFFIKRTILVQYFIL